MKVAGNKIARLQVRIEELELTMRILASGRKPCASGTQRVCRDEMKSIARECCLRLGIEWQE
jgi:hypothetical protein